MKEYSFNPFLFSFQTLLSQTTDVLNITNKTVNSRDLEVHPNLLILYFEVSVDWDELRDLES